MAAPPWFVTEGRLYDILLNSRKAEAKSFRKWVTNAVLPAIRKDGAYVIGEEKVATGKLSIEAMTLRVIGRRKPSAVATKRRGAGSFDNFFLGGGTVQVHRACIGPHGRKRSVPLANGLEIFRFERAYGKFR